LDTKRSDGLFRVGVEVLIGSFDEAPENKQMAERVVDRIGIAWAYADAGGDVLEEMKSPLEVGQCRLNR
jgi:hypothetical protein